MQVALALIWLPDQALLATDAIVRSLVRVLSGRGRRMLEWQTASQAERAIGYTRSAVWKRMWPAVVLAAVILAVLAWGAASSGRCEAPRWACVGAWGSLALVVAVRAGSCRGAQRAAHAAESGSRLRPARRFAPICAASLEVLRPVRHR